MKGSHPSILFQPFAADDPAGTKHLFAWIAKRYLKSKTCGIATFFQQNHQGAGFPLFQIDLLVPMRRMGTSTRLRRSPKLTKIIQDATHHPRVTMRRMVTRKIDNFSGITTRCRVHFMHLLSNFYKILSPFFKISPAAGLASLKSLTR